MAIRKYDILGVTPNANHEEIRAAYLRLAGTSHPDLNQKNRHAELHFKAIQLAYETLRDPVSRRAYDLGFDKAQPVVYSEGHHREPRLARPWPSHDAHDADFDITANQVNVAGRSNSAAAVAMCIVLLVSVGLSMTWLGRRPHPSAELGQHDTNAATRAPARTRPTGAHPPRADETQPLANEEVPWAKIGNAWEFESLPTDVDQPPAASLQLTSADQPSLDAASSPSIFALGMSVVDPSIFPSKTPPDVTPAQATAMEAEQQLAELRRLVTGATAFSSSHDKPRFALDDWQSVPLDPPLLTEDWQSMRLDPPLPLTGAMDFVFADDARQNSALAKSMLGSLNFVDRSSTKNVGLSLLASGEEDPEPYSLPLDASEVSEVVGFAGLDSSLVHAPVMSSGTALNAIRSANGGFSLKVPRHDDSSQGTVLFATSPMANKEEEIHHSAETTHWGTALRFSAATKPLLAERSHSNPSPDQKSDVYRNTSAHSLTQVNPFGISLTLGTTSSHSNWQQTRNRLDAHVDPGVPSLASSYLLSKEATPPPYPSVNAQLGSPSSLQNYGRNAWDTVSRLQNPTPEGPNQLDRLQIRNKVR